MTLLIVLITSIIVWLNRGLYDPSVPVLVAFFLYWTYETVFGRDRLKVVNRYLFALPWIFAVLFIFRNDLLYATDSGKTLLSPFRFFPLLGVISFELTKKAYGEGSRAVRSLLVLLMFLMMIPFLSPEPRIDVFQSNRLAVHFFLQGANPYSSIYPDIYQNQYDYHPGFLYWPGALLLQTFSELVFRDIRYVLILSWIFAAYLLKSRRSYFLAWLTLPFLAFAFEQAWLDPLIALGGVLTLYGLRKGKLVYWMIGVVLAATVKQYGFMIGLFSALYYIRVHGISRAIKPLAWMALLFSIILIPFIAWDPGAFLNMTVLTHASAKIRPDALNFTAFWLKITGQELSSLVQLGFIFLGLGLATVHVIKNQVARGLRVIPEAWAIFFGFSIFFGKFAFCNYFLLMISFWLMAETEGDEQALSEPVGLLRNT